MDPEKIPIKPSLILFLSALFYISNCIFFYKKILSLFFYLSTNNWREICRKLKNCGRAEKKRTNLKAKKNE